MESIQRKLGYEFVVEVCGMRVLAVSGSNFTWDNGREGSEFIQERIDLGFSNEKWTEIFLDAIIKHLNRCGSDHVPIQIVLNPVDAAIPCFAPKPYRFEAMWVDEESGVDVVRNAWENPGSQSSMRGVMGKVERCAGDLKEWDFSMFENVNWELRKVREELRFMGKNGMRGDLIFRRRELEARKRELMRREEAMWLQRSKANEFKWGD
ncbi:hypothetical protein V2J09_003538 [Rumex salicifolius]